MGYSPLPLATYLEFIETLSTTTTTTTTSTSDKTDKKLFIVSVTGTPDATAQAYSLVAQLAHRVANPLALEVNLSCPNIPGAPPPAYDARALSAYLEKLSEAASAEAKRKRIPWGIKTPPYTTPAQFDVVIEALLRAAAATATPEGEVCPVSFVTATNTLGSCLVLEDMVTTTTEGGEKGSNNPPKLPSSTHGLGGMAGPPLHPLALGNVASLRRRLDASEKTRHVQIIGVGGVGDAAGYRRMRSVGAVAVGVGTALGRKGVAVFGEIRDGLVGEGEKGESW